jgi:hypothetical protein
VGLALGADTRQSKQGRVQPDPAAGTPGKAASGSKGTGESGGRGRNRWARKRGVGRIPLPRGREATGWSFSQSRRPWVRRSLYLEGNSAATESTVAGEKRHGAAAERRRQWGLFARV